MYIYIYIYIYTFAYIYIYIYIYIHVTPSRAVSHYIVLHQKMFVGMVRDIPRKHSCSGKSLYGLTSNVSLETSTKTSWLIPKKHEMCRHTLNSHKMKKRPRGSCNFHSQGSIWKHYA